ncbi:GNAT family N-acetyltransferase [Plantactinospora endophytica]|uniref:N-acetyltransferase domain-containing protein n=1 Tax=Plantactinospora endophytica TaxID=673535 RepID=A0ABQ4EE74_9ACTN|nr:GNAT family N-acetyltransferase [Plantactinospora endophytica]GIG93024.1 hypothetical protein Pen02_79600 [Plantactinospora endophytica]
MLMRPPHVGEAPAVLALAGDPDVRLWNPRCQIPDEAAAIADCLTGADWSDGTHTTFSIIDDATGAYAGTISLHDINWHGRSAYVGYRVAPWTRGRGVARTCLRTLSEWAFTALRLDRIALTHAVENVASCRVARAAGFTLEKVLPPHKRFGDGLVHDEHLHVLRLASAVTGKVRRVSGCRDWM